MRIRGTRSWRHEPSMKAAMGLLYGLLALLAVYVPEAYAKPGNCIVYENENTIVSDESWEKFFSFPRVTDNLDDKLEPGVEYYTFPKTENVLDVRVLGNERFLHVSLDEETSAITVTAGENFPNIKENLTINQVFDIPLLFECETDTSVLVARLQLSDSNRFPPKMTPEVETYTIAMPVPNGYTITNSRPIKGIDYDFGTTRIEAILPKGMDEWFTAEIMGVMGSTYRQGFNLVLTTKKEISWQEEKKFDVTIKDYGTAEDPTARSSIVSIAIEPDEGSSFIPRFAKPIYNARINDIDVDKPLLTIPEDDFLEGYSGNLNYSLEDGGSEWEQAVDLFEAVPTFNGVEIRWRESITSADELLHYAYAIIILTATNRGARLPGKTIVHFHLPRIEPQTTPCECACSCPPEISCPACEPCTTPRSSMAWPMADPCPTHIPTDCPTERECPTCETDSTGSEIPILPTMPVCPLTCPPVTPCTPCPMETTTENTNRTTTTDISLTCPPVTECPTESTSTLIPTTECNCPSCSTEYPTECPPIPCPETECPTVTCPECVECSSTSCTDTPHTTSAWPEPNSTVSSCTCPPITECPTMTTTDGCPEPTCPDITVTECPPTVTCLPTTECPICSTTTECPSCPTVTEYSTLPTITDCPVCPPTDLSTSSTTTDCPVYPTNTECPSCPTVTECPICPTTTEYSTNSTTTDCPTNNISTPCPTCPTVTECPTCPTVTECPTCPTECPASPVTTECQSCPPITECPTFPTSTEFPGSSITTECPTCPTTTDCGTGNTTTECPICPTTPEYQSSPTTTGNPSTLTSTECSNCPASTECPQCPITTECPTSPTTTEYPSALTTTEFPSTPTPTECPTSTTTECPTCPTTTECPTCPTTTECPTCPTTAECPTCPTTTECPTCPTTTECPTFNITTECPTSSTTECPTYPPESSSPTSCPDCNCTPTATECPSTLTSTDFPSSPTPTECPTCPSCPITTECPTSSTTTGCPTSPTITECPTSPTTTECPTCPTTTECPTCPTTSECPTFNITTECPTSSTTECPTYPPESSSPTSCPDCNCTSTTNPPVTCSQSTECPITCPPVTECPTTDCFVNTTTNPDVDSTFPSTTIPPTTTEEGSPNTLKFKKDSYYKGIRANEEPQLLERVELEIPMNGVEYSLEPASPSTPTGALTINNEGEVYLIHPLPLGVNLYYVHAEIIGYAHGKVQFLVYVSSICDCEDKPNKFMEALRVEAVDEHYEAPVWLTNNDTNCTLDMPNNKYFELKGCCEVWPTKALDREAREFDGVEAPVVKFTLVITCSDGEDGDHGEEDGLSSLQLTSRNSSNEAIYNVPYDPKATVLAFTIRDINDNYPVFTISSDIIGYPGSEVISHLPVPELMVAEATDRDIGQNARIRYSLDKQGAAKFEVNADTGAVYPRSDAASPDDGFTFKIHASDRDNDEEVSEEEKRKATLDVTVRTLKMNHLVELVVNAPPSSLSDLLSKAGSQGGRQLRTLTISVFVPEDEIYNNGDGKNTGNNGEDGKRVESEGEREYESGFHERHSLRENVSTPHTAVRAIVYSIKGQVPEDRDAFARDLEKVIKNEGYEAKTRAPDFSPISDTSSNKALIITVIVLSCLLALVLITAFVVGYWLRIRSNRSNDPMPSLFQDDQSITTSNHSMIGIGSLQDSILQPKDKKNEKQDKTINPNLNIPTDLGLPRATLLDDKSRGSESSDDRQNSANWTSLEPV